MTPSHNHPPNNRKRQHCSHDDLILIPKRKLIEEPTTVHIKGNQEEEERDPCNIEKEITVYTLVGSCLRVRVEGSALVSDLKMAIFMVCGVLPVNQMLVCRGMLVEDSWSVESLDEIGEKVFVVVRMTSGLDAFQQVVENVVERECRAESLMVSDCEKELHLHEKKCHSCQKRLYLSVFKCKCGLHFCSIHRMPEVHRCE